LRKIDLSNFQVATSETARDINRRIMLNLVRKHQPVSRADLARHSGLQRSTVSVIAEQFLTERWLREGAVGQSQRGRKPRFLHLNADRAGIIGINVRPGLTHMALAGLDGHFLARESMPTAACPDQFLSDITQRIHGLRQTYPQLSYEGIGVSLPGRVDALSERVVFAPNLGWKEERLKPRLESLTGLPVELENEANACALSEFWFGRQTEGVRNLMAVAVSVGIGVGIILNGQLVRGPFGLAGEFGHVSMAEDGPRCSCGNLGCWEVYASNRAALRYYAEAGSSRRHQPPCPRSARPVSSFEDVLRLAEQGDVPGGGRSRPDGPLFGPRDRHAGDGHGPGRHCGRRRGDTRLGSGWPHYRRSRQAPFIHPCGDSHHSQRSGPAAAAARDHRADAAETFRSTINRMNDRSNRHLFVSRTNSNTRRL